MPEPFPLQDLLELARRRSDAAAADLGVLHALGRDAQQQLQRLLEFRDEYQARFRDRALGGIDHAAWRNFQHFMDRLDDAIAMQRDAVEQTHRRAAAGLGHWQAEQRKAMSFDLLSERHRKAEQLRERRREQKEHDDRCGAKVAAAQRAHAG